MCGIAVVGATLSFSRTNEPESSIGFPKDYRKWVHIKSTLLGEDHPNVRYRGYNHIYANDLAFKGYETGYFPEGSTIVLDVVAATAADKALVEGKHALIDIMVKDSVRFASTGGWQFAEFDGNGVPIQLSAEQVLTCYRCHQRPNDRVFCDFRK